MKKLLLFISATFFTQAVIAQVSHGSMMRLNDRSSDKNMKDLREQFLGARLQASNTGTANKGTGTARRTYNYVDYLAKINSDILTDINYVSLPYMWFRPDVMGVYNNGANLVADTINLSSYGFVLNPTWARFNDISAYTPGTMKVSDEKPYSLDSVRVYGYYGRNPNTTTTVDTLRIGMTYGNGAATNIGLGFYTGMTGRYMVDTVETAIVNFDNERHTLEKPIASTGPAIIYKDIYLTAADTANRAFTVAANMNVPTGNNLLAVSVTFKSGENYTPYRDSAFVGSIDPSAPFRMGMFRPFVFVEKTNTFPTYEQGNYNSGQFKSLPDQAMEYGPTWGWYSNLKTGGIGPSTYQFPYVDFVIGCSSCSGVSVNELSSVNLGSPFPNPASDYISVPVRTSIAGKVMVEVIDMQGRILVKQDLGLIPPHQTIHPRINTTDLANGVYIFNVKGQSGAGTTRFTVVR